MHNLGLILKKLREQHRYTQAEVGKKLDVSTTTISRWENNDKKPCTGKLIELSILYNIDMNYLIGVPMEDKLNINGLTVEQRRLIHTIVGQFRTARKEKRLSNEQQNIINALFQEFSN